MQISQIIMKTHSLTDLQFDVYDKKGQITRTLRLPTEEAVMNLYTALSETVNAPQRRIGKLTVPIVGVPHEFTQEEWTTLFVLMEHDWWTEYFSEQVNLLQ